eukprot:12444095-Alexandrium_andersonii.AAC.1
MNDGARGALRGLAGLPRGWQCREGSAVAWREGRGSGLWCGLRSPARCDLQRAQDRQRVREMAETAWRPRMLLLLSPTCA